MKPIAILLGLMLCVCCTKPQPKQPMFHVISADPCNLQLVGTVGGIKYVLKTEESYFVDATGSKHLTFLTKEEYDAAFKKWEANRKSEDVPHSSVCAGLPMDAAGKDFPVTVDNGRGVIVIVQPANKTTTTFMIEHEEEVQTK